MYRLVEFIRRSYVTILFVVLEIVAVSIYMRSTLYTRARILSKVYSAVGGAASARAGVASYFSLAKENRMLTGRIAELEREVEALREAGLAADTLDAPYGFIPARVVANSVNRLHNFITLDRGMRDGVYPSSAVVTPEGAVVGYILECSDRYSVALSILNTSFRTSGKIEGSEYSGSIEWRGENQYEVTMYELSKYAEIEVGSRVVTTGFSHYFAPDMPVGTVESFGFDDTKTSYTAVVKLDAEMSRLHNVLIIAAERREELLELETEAAAGVF